ncbi:MAG: hypothetical protein WDN27_05495 [Candidatus Saccharibacteria bacterium]
MSIADKNHHHPVRKGESKAHSAAHKYDMKKMASVVNHVDFERHHGFESTKHKEKKAE